MARRNRAEIELGAQDKTKAAFDAVGRRFADITRTADRAGRRLTSVAGVLTGAVAGLSVAGVFSAFVRETRAAEQEQAQLAAVLRSTGEAAGFSRDQLNAMSEELARASTFSAGEITSAQTRLLSYTGIVGEQFPQAMQAVIDMAARMGMSLEQSAETIGRALDIPSAGLTALTKQGFRFTEEQKKVVKALEDSGRTGEAQQIILEALQSSYGGAARAARDTFGGAVQALQNELKSLVTGKDGSLDGARQAVEDLIKTLQAPETKQAIQGLLELFANLAKGAVAATNAFLGFGRGLGERFGQFVAGSTDPLEIANQRLRESTFEVETLGKEIERLSRINTRGQFTQEIADLQSRLQQSQRDLENWRKSAAFLSAEVGPQLPAAASGPAGSPGRRPPPPVRDEEAERRAKQEAERARAYFENLQLQLRGMQELTAAEIVLDDIQRGRLKLVGGLTEEMVLGVALEIDARRELKKAIEDQAKAREEEERQMAQRLQAATAEADSVEAQNKSLREQIEEIGKTASQLAELRARRLEDAAAQQEQAVAAAQLMGVSEGEIAQMQRRVELLREQAGLVREEGKKTAQEMDDFAKNAAQNVQRYLGDQFVNIMEGNFKSVGDSFIGMINRMVAEALAADLVRSLFGAKGGGEGSGLLGTALSWIGGFMGGGRATGGGVMPGGIYPVTELGEPELLRMSGRNYLMVPDAGLVEPMGRAQSGKTVTITVNQHFGQGTDSRTTAQAAADARRALEMGARNL